MNKKLNNNFSLRKLLLTALISGPLATLPAPLWALPDVTAANLTATGATTQVVGTTLNVNAVDKAVLTWQAFGSGASPINAGDIINYFLPPSGSVLNAVSGGVASTISGQILSNGNVYVLNPSGIIISPTAQINVGGFYASTVAEPNSYFTVNGTLSFAGTSNANVVVQGTGVNGGVDAAQIQAVGTGNNIYLAGQAVDVQGGKFFGNLFVRASNATGGGPLAGGNNVRFGETGPVSINLVGSPLAGGGLNITSNGGNVKLTGGVQAVLTATAVTAGTLTSIATGSGGTGYNPPPVVTISAPPAGGILATAIARVDSAGVIQGFTITNPGSGYLVAPTVTVTTPGGATNQVHNPVLTGDFISNIPVTAGTAGYLASPAVTITPVGGVGAGATATAIINTSGAISGYAITAAGAGYTAAPTVTVAAGATAAAPGTAAITLAGVGAAAAAIGTGGGSGYATAPTVTVSGGGGTGAIANATLTGGVVTGYTLLAAGSGYTSAPTVTVSAPTNGSLTRSPNVGSTTGALSINTKGNGVQGNITQGASAIIANTSGQVVTLDAGAGGNITLGSIDTLTLGATGNNIAITDTAGDITLNKITAAGTLTVNAAASILQGANTAHVVGGLIALSTLDNITTYNFTGSGDLNFGTIGTNRTVAISAPGNITFTQALNVGRGLTLTSTGGTITAGAITTGSTMTISATSAAGSLVASSLRGNSGSVTVTGNISGATVAGVVGTTGVSTPGALTITSTAGNLTLGAVAATTAVTLNATVGTISTAAITTAALTMSAPAGSVTATGLLSNSNTATISSGTVTLAGISSTSALTVTASTGNLTTTAISTNSTLTLSAPSAAGVLTTGTITASLGQPVSLTSGATLNLAGGNVQVLNATSTAGSITQAAAITSTGTVTANALNDITLTTATNDFATVVLKGGAGGTTGIQVTDRNAITVGGGTTALGNTTITAGAGIQTYGVVAPVVTIATPFANAAATATINTASGALTALAATVTSSGVIQNGGGFITAPTVTVSAPINPANPVGLIRATATAQINALTGVITGYTITNAGAGYTAAPTVVIGNAAAQGTLTTLAGGLSGGALNSVTVIPGTAPYSAAPVVTIATNVTNGGASATSSLNAVGIVSGVTPTQSGSITLGNAAIEVLSFAQNLTLTSSGIAGGTLAAPIYSGLTTPANSVSVFGNVSLNGKGTAFTLGNNTFGTAAKYTYGQISADLFTGNATGGALSINETQTVNLGTITAGSLDARSLAANIVNTGKITIAAGNNSVFAANSIFNPGDVTLNFATNAISGPILIGNAREFSLTNTVNTTVTAGTALVNGKAATGAVNVTVTGATSTLTMNTALGGDYNTIGFTSGGGAVSITDPNGITLQNASNIGTGSVSVTAAGPVILGSGIVLNGTGGTFISSTGSSASITDSAPRIQINGNVAMASDGIISIGQSNHSMGAVSLVTTGATAGVANASANITYTEGGTANLNVVNVNTSGLATAGGTLTVASTGGSIIQTPAANAGITATSPVGTIPAGLVSAPAALTLAGSGYSSVNPPAVTIAAAPVGGTNATATATVNALGQVTGFVMTNAGAGYLAAPTFRVAAPAGGTIGGTIGGTASLTSSAGGVTLTNPSGNNNIGASIALTAVTDSSVAQSQNITLGNIAVTAGTFSADNSSSNAKTITQASTTTARIIGASTFNTQGGAITLTNTDGFGNNFGAVSARSSVVNGVDSVVGTAATTVAGTGLITLPTVTVAGTGYLPGSTTIPVTVTGGTVLAAGTLPVVTANVGATGDIVSYNLTPGTQTYGAGAGPTLTVAAPVTAAGANIAITEAGTLNFAQVKTGTAGKLTAVSSAADIIQTSTGGVQVGGATVLTSANDVTLNLAGTVNSFGGNTGISITAPGNASIQDASAITALAGGSSIKGNLTVKNTFATGGEIKDLPGTISALGNVWFDTGTTYAPLTDIGARVTLGSSSITLGAVKFNSGKITLVENDSINIAPGIVASGPVSLTSSKDIITSGAGGGTFQNTLTLNATGAITILNPIFVVGSGAVGLTFRALGVVNLDALSLAGNLNGINPTSLGYSTYIWPKP